MKAIWRTFWKWLLVVLTVVVDTLAVGICLLFSPLEAKDAFALASGLHLNAAPPLLLRLVDRLALVGIVLLWVFPIVFAVRFALGARRLSWQWGFFASFLLLACFFWFLSQSNGEIGMRWAVVGAVCLLVAERLASTRKLLPWGPQLQFNGLHCSSSSLR